MKNKMPLQTFELWRDYREATKGNLINPKTKLTIVATLEPPNRNNAKDNPNTPENEAGCIPEGTYHVKRRNPKDYEKLPPEQQPRFKDNWEILNVPNKSGVVFHSGNYWFHSKSCILVGNTIIDMNPNNDPKLNNNRRWYCSQSRPALSKFTKIMPEEFILKIISHETENLNKI